MMMSIKGNQLPQIKPNGIKLPVLKHIKSKSRIPISPEKSPSKLSKITLDGSVNFRNDKEHLV